MGQLIDVSCGGLAFQYIATADCQGKDPCHASSTLMIFSSLRSIRLEEFVIIYDIELESNHHVALRRCGIKFQRLPAEHLFHVENLVEVCRWAFA